jgi:hypothetical protein
MSKETIQFTVKGPISVQRYPEQSNTTDRQKKTGCSIIDISLQQPSQLGEIVFKNYYTAFISIYVKRSSSKGRSMGYKQSATMSSSKVQLLENSSTFDASSYPSKYHARNAIEMFPKS